MEPNPHDPPVAPEQAPPLGRNARIGLALFGVYLLLYGAYVLVNAFAPTVMENRIAGVNLAILSGFGLIVAALAMALLYGFLCGPEETAAGEDA